jgi:ribosomal protein S18 acetylase RimI-like enzyme
MNARPGAADFNRFFRGATYGTYPIFTARSYADFVRSNDVDLARAINHFDADGELIGTLAFAQRGDRAWFGLVGVERAQRSAGLGKRLVAQALDAVRAAGARSVELETVQRNGRAIALVEGFGFTKVGELHVWARDRRRGNAELRFRTFSERAVGEIAGSLAACWQREARSIALAGRSALLRVSGAYAFVRVKGEFATILDAGANDVAAAHTMLNEIDARVPYDLTLNNEPEESPLSRALRQRDWRIVERQCRMMVRALSSRA